MSDLAKIILGALGGLTVFVVGQLLARFFIEPLHELRKTVGEVRFNLAFHAPTIHTPIGRSKETSDKAREALLKSSCQLMANLHAVPCYEVTRLFAFGALPCSKAIEDAAVQLRGLSTYVYDTGEHANEALEAIQQRVARVESLLRLQPLA